METQELFYTRDHCNLKHICLLNIKVDGSVFHEDKHLFYKSLTESEQWKTIVEGSSGAVGCVETMFADRYFACFTNLAYHE